MQIISSYGVELRKQNIPIRQTLEIYRSAVSYLIGIYVQIWEKLAEIPDAKRRFNAAEHLVHTTKKNHACFDFDIRFPKMPSYLRRSAIQHALGTVSSYKTRLDLWEKTDGKSGKPRIVYENHAMPVFYRDVMDREGAEGKDEAYRNEFIRKMAELEVATNVHYKPLPMHTAYKKLGFDIKDYPNAYQMYHNEITLPLHTCLSDEEVEYVLDCFAKVLRG